MSPISMHSDSMKPMIMLITDATMFKCAMVIQAHSVVMSYLILSKCDVNSYNVAGTSS